MTNPIDFERHPLRGATEKYVADRGEINRRYRGRERKIRLMQVDLTYALVLIEGNLGAPDVRENWKRCVDRMWRSRRSEEAEARSHLLSTIAYAEETFHRRRPEGGYKRPRSSKRRLLFSDANLVDHYMVMELPSIEEAAEEGLNFLASFDPELAERIAVADIATILPSWMDRRKNTGRRAKSRRIDDELCALMKRLGYGPTTAGAMQKQRVAWEKTWPFVEPLPDDDDEGRRQTPAA